MRNKIKFKKIVLYRYKFKVFNVLLFSHSLAQSKNNTIVLINKKF